MNADVKQKWIAALRSGGYEQAFGALAGRNGRNGRCCLGVLCEVAIQDDVIGDYDAARPFVPLDVKVWADIDPDEEQQAVNWNDFRRLSFAEIADRLEQAA